MKDPEEIFLLTATHGATWFYVVPLFYCEIHVQPTLTQTHTHKHTDTYTRKQSRPKSEGIAIKRVNDFRRNRVHPKSTLDKFLQPRGKGEQLQKQ